MNRAVIKMIALAAAVAIAAFCTPASALAVRGGHVRPAYKIYPITGHTTGMFSGWVWIQGCPCWEPTGNYDGAYGTARNTTLTSAAVKFGPSTSNAYVSSVSVVTDGKPNKLTGVSVYLFTNPKTAVLEQTISAPGGADQVTVTPTEIHSSAATQSIQFSTKGVPDGPPFFVSIKDAVDVDIHRASKACSPAGLADPPIDWLPTITESGAGSKVSTAGYPTFWPCKVAMPTSFKVIPK